MLSSVPISFFIRKINEFPNKSEQNPHPAFRTCPCRRPRPPVCPEPPHRFVQLVHHIWKPPKHLSPSKGHTLSNGLRIQTGRPAGVFRVPDDLSKKMFFGLIFLLQFPAHRSRMVLQFKIGSCNEVLRARAATITQRVRLSVSNQIGLKHFFLSGIHPQP